jgi:hypothetical protein
MNIILSTLISWFCDLISNKRASYPVCCQRLVVESLALSDRIVQKIVLLAVVGGSMFLIEFLKDLGVLVD